MQSLEPLPSVPLESILVDHENGNVVVVAPFHHGIIDLSIDQVLHVYYRSKKYHNEQDPHHNTPSTAGIHDIFQEQAISESDTNSTILILIHPVVFHNVSLLTTNQAVSNRECLYAEL
jgi:hypothetical protein